MVPVDRIRGASLRVPICWAPHPSVSVIMPRVLVEFLWLACLDLGLGFLWVGCLNLAFSKVSTYFILCYASENSYLDT